MKATKSTIKSFIRKNEGSIFINVKSSFDGMTDGLEYRYNGFSEAEKDETNTNHTLGINGAWFVGSSRDYIREYRDNQYTGYEIYNCCGTFILAVKK